MASEVALDAEGSEAGTESATGGAVRSLAVDRFVYVGRTRCGCAVGVITDNGDEYTANGVAEFIKDGLTVNRAAWSVYEQIAEEKTFMACPHGQLALPLNESGGKEVGGCR